MTRTPVKVCDPSRLVCPRCEAPLRRQHALWGGYVTYCSTKTQRPGERCNTWLAIIVEGPTAVVTALGSADAADQVVAHYRQLSARAAAERAASLAPALASAG